MLSIVVALAIIALAYGIQCGKWDSNMGATFDLTDLIRTNEQPAFQVEDGDIPCTAKVEPNYTYLFNVCGTVPGDYVPTNCRKVPGVSGAGALQINKLGTVDEKDDYCYNVGSYNEATKMTLIKSDDPTKGIKLTYLGDYCKGASSPRKFMIELSCADTLNPVPLHAYELAGCEYTISMPSVYGCPLECPVANRHLCGGNGHCAYDEDKQGARCFCNSGYSGSDCASSSSSDTLNYSPALLGLIITLFIIVAILVASIAFMYRQMTAYKEDLANYQVLKGSEHEESTVV